MAIKVLFFASLREQLGKSAAEVAWQPDLNITQVWQQASGQDAMTATILIAKNQSYCDADAPLEDGDELAFFPPVTGG